MKTIFGVYGHLAEMLAKLEPEAILALRPSNEVQNRFNLLLEKFKKAEIDPKEKDELDHFIVLERLFRLAKIRADESSLGLKS